MLCDCGLSVIGLKASDVEVAGCQACVFNARQNSKASGLGFRVWEIG